MANAKKKARRGGEVMATKPGKTPLGQVHLTERQFEVIHFKDSYDRDCLLEQSSIADFEPPGSSALWLGIPCAQVSPAYNTVMHLKLDQVKALVATLEMWIERCSFDENYKPGTRK